VRTGSRGRRRSDRQSTAGQQEELRRVPRAVRAGLPRSLRAGRLSRPLCPRVHALPLLRLRVPDTLPRSRIRGPGPLPRSRIRAGTLSRPLLQPSRDHRARIQTPAGRLPVGGAHVPHGHHGRPQTGAGAGRAPRPGARRPTRARRSAPAVPRARQPPVPGGRHQTRRRAGGPTVPGNGVQTVPGARVPADARRGPGGQARRHRRTLRRQTSGPCTARQVSCGSVVPASLARLRSALSRCGGLPGTVRVPGTVFVPSADRLPGLGVPGRRAGVLSTATGGSQDVRRQLRSERSGGGTATDSPGRIFVPTRATGRGRHRCPSPRRRRRPSSSPASRPSRGDRPGQRFGFRRGLPAVDGRDQSGSAEHRLLGQEEMKLATDYVREDCSGVAHNQQSTRNSRTRIENDISFKPYRGSPSLGRRVPRDDDCIS